MSKKIYALVSDYYSNIWCENGTGSLEFPSGLITVSTDLNKLYALTKSLLTQLKQKDPQDYQQLLSEKTTNLSVIELKDGQFASLEMTDWHDNNNWYRVPFDLIKDIEKMKYTKPLPFNTFQYIYNYEFTPEKLKNILDNPEIKPVLIIGQDGSGKMSLMSQFAQDYQDECTVLLTEFDLLMGNSAQNIETVFKDAIASQKGSEHDLVIVMNECHQLFLQNTKICQLYHKYNKKLAEARIHLIGLTTKEEYDAIIKPALLDHKAHAAIGNALCLVQYPSMPDDTIYRILKNRLSQYHIDQNTETDKVLNALMALPVPDNKSKLRYTISLLYQMIGWHRAWNKNIDQQLLNSVIQANKK